MHRITCSAFCCSESIDICPEVVGDTSLTAFCQRAQGWGKAKRSSHVYCEEHRTQTEPRGPEYNHPVCLGRHNSTSTSSSTAGPVHFSNATEGRQPRGDPGLESSCGVMSSSESKDEPEAESKLEPKPRHLKPEVRETEDLEDGWHGYYRRALLGLEDYEPWYPGLEGIAILDDKD